MKAVLRPYQQQDQGRLNEIFHALVPVFFDAAELGDFHAYLEQHAATFAIMEQGGEVLAGGGYLVDEEGIGFLKWYLVDPKTRGLGLGHQLASWSIAEMEQAGIETIRVSTSQHGQGFFARYGMAVIKEEADYWGPGLDLVLMERQ